MVVLLCKDSHKTVRVLIEFSIYFADCSSTSGLDCIPLQQCPQVNEIALKIQELGVHETTRKLELLNIINHKLCGGRIKKELHVCCNIEIEKIEDPSSVSDNSNKHSIRRHLGVFVTPYFDFYTFLLKINILKMAIIKYLLEYIYIYILFFVSPLIKFNLNTCIYL